MRKTLIIALFISSGFTTIAQAASFDCAKASTTVEKLICADEKLSVLDDQLTAAYKTASETATDKAAFKTQQRDWLKKKRNACKNAECLTKTYQARIDEITKKDVASKPKFKILKGQQFEVCRVFNDYLNYQYQAGDCFLKNYPADKRLRSPEFTPTDIVQYEEQEIADSISFEKDKEEQVRIAQRIRRVNKENSRIAWAANVDISNSGTKDSILFAIRSDQMEQNESLMCTHLGGSIDLLVDNKIDNNKWHGGLSGFPIIFDGRTFLLYGGTDVYQMYEPSFLKPEQRYGSIHNHGDTRLTFICNLDSNHY
jgi:uncharacterized protein